MTCAFFFFLFIKKKLWTAPLCISIDIELKYYFPLLLSPEDIGGLVKNPVPWIKITLNQWACGDPFLAPWKGPSSAMMEVSQAGGTLPEKMSQLNAWKKREVH